VSTIISKPINLIIANTMHAAVASIQDAQHTRDAMTSMCNIPSKPVDLTGVNELVARRLLCDIAHQASVKDILTCLGACNAPNTLDLIGEGMQAVKDEQGIR